MVARASQKSCEASGPNTKGRYRRAYECLSDILIYTWLQRQFVKIVVKPLGCEIEHQYGDYDREFDEDLPGGDTWTPKTPDYKPMEIWVNEIYTFDSLVDAQADYKPPFDYILVYEASELDGSWTTKYIPFNRTPPSLMDSNGLICEYL